MLNYLLTERHVKLKNGRKFSVLTNRKQGIVERD